MLERGPRIIHHDGLAVRDFAEMRSHFLLLAYSFMFPDLYYHHYLELLGHMF